MKRQILPSITTAGPAKQKWPSQLEEVERLGLRECGLFVTGLEYEERRVLFALLQGVGERAGLRIPFVHARSDMKVEEYAFLIENFGTQAFNLHSRRDIPLLERLPGWLRKMIYIELDRTARASDLRGFAGICSDLSHIEDYRLQGWGKEYFTIQDLIKRFPVGASHISAVSREPYVFKNGNITYAPHLVSSFADLNYLKNYPRYYFGPLVAIELENSISEQLVIKKYIEQNIWRLQSIGVEHEIGSPVNTFALSTQTV